MKKEAKKIVSIMLIVSIIMMIFTTGIVNSAAISDPFGLDLALGNIISDIVPISDSDIRLQFVSNGIRWNFTFIG